MGHFEMHEGSPEDTALNTKTQSTQRRGISLCTLCFGVDAASNGKPAAVFKWTHSLFCSCSAEPGRGRARQLLYSDSVWFRGLPDVFVSAARPAPSWQNPLLFLSVWAVCFWPRNSSLPGLTAGIGFWLK